MPMPKPDKEASEYLRSVLPDDPRVTVKPMFGHLAAFVNGNMFSGVLGPDLFVRLDAESQEELLAIPGAAPFAPMPERPMTGYIVVPSGWRGEPERAREWVRRSLDWTGGLPVKLPKKRK